MKSNLPPLKSFEEENSNIDNLTIDQNHNEMSDNNQSEHLNETLNSLNRYQIQLQEDIEKIANDEEIEKPWNKEEDFELEEEIYEEKEEKKEKILSNVKKIDQMINTGEEKCNSSEEKLEIVQENINKISSSFWAFLWEGFSSIFNWLGPTATIIIGTGMGCFIFYRLTAAPPVTNISYPPLPYYPTQPPVTSSIPSQKVSASIIAAIIGFIFGRRSR